jgi:hypothetical protein
MSEEPTLNENDANVTRIVRAICPNGRPMIVQAEYCVIDDVEVELDVDTVVVFPIFDGIVGERLPITEEEQITAALGLAQILDRQ